MTLVKQADYLGEARRRLTIRFKNLPRVDGLLQSYMAEVQSIEDAAWELLVARLIENNPTGDLEDKIGELVGQPRNGQTDGEYLIFIVARIRANRSDGRRGTLLDIVSLLVNQQEPIRMRAFLKAIDVVVDDVPVNPWVIWHDFLNGAKAAGDKIRFGFSMRDRSLVLVRASVSGGVTTVTTQRKGSVSGPYGGGVFAGIFGGF